MRASKTNRNKCQFSGDAMIEDLIEDIRKFNRARNWDKFHTPKNLATSVVIEAAELAECFQWLTPDESIDPENMDEIADEVADVLIYLLNLCDKLHIVPGRAIYRKLRKNAAKYPTKEAK